MESFYFACITLSTVGFGDYVIGEWPKAGGVGTQLPGPPRQAWECTAGDCLMWVAFWAWDTACRLCSFRVWRIMISRVLPGSVELFSKATGSDQRPREAQTFGPPSLLHPARGGGEDPDETIRELRAP